MSIKKTQEFPLKRLVLKLSLTITLTTTTYLCIPTQELSVSQLTLQRLIIYIPIYIVEAQIIDIFLQHTERSARMSKRKSDSRSSREDYQRQPAYHTIFVYN